MYLYYLQGNAEKFWTYFWNDLRRLNIPDRMFWYRNIDTIKAIPDNTKHMCLTLPNDNSVPYLKILSSIFFADVLIIYDNGNVENFENTSI